MVLYIGFRWGLLQMIKKDTRYSDTENTKMLNFFTDRVEPPLKAESRVVLCILEVMSLGKVVMSLVSILILLYNIQNVESMFTKNPQ